MIIPAVEAKLKEHSKIRLLYHLGPDFSGYNAIALWDDAKVGLKHLTHFDRIAVVTDTDWIATAVKVFGFMMPGEVRCFDNDQLAEAETWIAKRRKPRYLRVPGRTHRDEQDLKRLCRIWNKSGTTHITTHRTQRIIGPFWSNTAAY